MNMKRMLAAGVGAALVIALLVVMAFSAASDYEIRTGEPFSSVSFTGKLEGDGYTWRADINESILWTVDTPSASPTQITSSQLTALINDGDLYAEYDTDFFKTGKLLPPSGGSAEIMLVREQIYRAQTITANDNIFSNIRLKLKNTTTKNESDKTQVKASSPTFPIIIPQLAGSLDAVDDSKEFTDTVNLNKSAAPRNIDIYLTTAMFGLSGNANTLIEAKFKDKDIKPELIAGTTGVSYQPTILYSSGLPYVRITIGTDITEGAHEIKVGLKSVAHNDQFVDGRIATITLVVTDDTSTTYPITGGQNAMGFGAQTMARGAAVQSSLRYPSTSSYSVFTYSSSTHNNSNLTIKTITDSLYKLDSVTTAYSATTSDGVMVFDKGTTTVNPNFTAQITPATTPSAEPYLRIAATSDAEIKSTAYDLEVYLVSPTRPNIKLASIQPTIRSTTAATKITGVDTSTTHDFEVLKNDSALSTSETKTSLAVQPGDKISVKFDTDAFTWEGGAKPYPAQSISGLTNASTVKAQVQSNTKDRDLLEKTTFDIKHVAATSTVPGYSYIEVNFKVPFVSTKDRDFTIPIELRYGNSSGVITTTISGTLSNDVVYVSGGDRSIDASGGNGYILDVDGSANNATISLDDGIELKTSLRRGLYYAYVDTEEDEDDDDILDKYRDVQRVYNLYTIGLNGSDTKVDLNESSSYHIYNKNMEYLGTGPDIRTLPYSTKYYVSTRKLDIKDDDDDDTTNKTDPVVETPIGTTPGTVSPINENANPGTGGYQD